MVAIAESMSKVLDVSEEDDPEIKEELLKISNEKNKALLALIAPYVGKKSHRQRK